MKILVLGSYDRSLVMFRGELLRALVVRGHEVVACAPRLTPEVRTALADWEVRSRSVALARTGTNPLADVRTMLRLRILMRDERPDVLLAYTVKPIVYGVLAARKAGVERIFSLVTGLGHTFQVGSGLHHHLVSSVVRRLYGLAMDASNTVFFQNPDDLGEFRASGLLRAPTRAVVVNGSGVDLAHYAPAPLPQEPSFLLIARLLGEKGVREYVDAARVVRRRNPLARFRLAGWIDSNPSAIRSDELQAWVSEGVIEYLGTLDDVRPAISAASTFVLPSYREGTPRTVLEAMAMGRAIITTDTPGCRETVISGENGFLVPPRDVDALASAMSDLLEHPERIPEMGARSRSIAEERYDVHAVNRVILEAMGL